MLRDYIIMYYGEDALADLRPLLPEKKHFEPINNAREIVFDD